MTFGFSRDDAAKFLGAYYEKKIYESDPFQHLDQIGVGKLIKMAAHDGRETRPDLGLGICGETAAIPPASSSATMLAWTTSAALRSVCLSRLAAAQAAIRTPASNRVRGLEKARLKQTKPPVSVIGSQRAFCVLFVSGKKVQ